MSEPAVGSQAEEKHFFDEKQKELGWAVPPESDDQPRFAAFVHYDWLQDTGQLIPRVSHVVLAVTDLDRSEAWYRDFFGLDVVGRDLTGEDKPHSVLRTNSGELVILVQRDTVAPMHAMGVHHAFTMTPNQYRRMLDRAKAKSHEMGVFRADFLAPGEYGLNFEDPDGHGVELDTTTIEADQNVPPGVGVVDCGPVDRFALGDVRVSNEGNFFLVRLAEGFLAMTRRCTHMNGVLTYDKDHWRFFCPYHHACFDRRGDPLGGQPALDALRLNPVTLSADGHVLVNTDEIIPREFFDPSQAVSWGSGARGQGPVGRTTSSLTSNP
ncbi:MAG: hypothetical protein HW416_3450 [Chloroflexi bacterium]|nr:hypothetical protein [Chloroflexota bacterium]